MIEINYKRLAEIQILHEFYLFRADGSSFFEMIDEEQKEQLLMDRVIAGLYNMQRDLEIIPTEATKRILKAYRIKFGPTSTGLLLGLEVEENQVNNKLEYQPKIPPKEGLTLSFQIKLARPSFRNFTNIPMGSSLPAIYFFSNRNDDEEPQRQKQYPSLSLPAPVMEPGKQYPMGTLAYDVFPGGDLFEAQEYASGDNATQWEQIEDKRYVSESDRILLPHKFTYRLRPGEEIKEVEFILRDSEDTRVKKIQLKSETALRSVVADFSHLDGGSVDAPAPEIPPGFYTLIVRSKTTGGVFEETSQVLLDSTRYDRQALGVVEFHFSRGASDFHLLNANGSIKTDAINEHPVFQLLMKSRKTYWRYISSKKKNLEAEPLAAPFLNKLSTGDRDLVSKVPRYLSVIPTLFQTDDPASTGVDETVFLPNPAPEALRLEGGRFFSDIHVGPLKNLIKDS